MPDVRVCRPQQKEHPLQSWRRWGDYVDLRLRAQVGCCCVNKSSLLNVNLVSHLSDRPEVLWQGRLRTHNIATPVQPALPVRPKVNENLGHAGGI